jgi:hypothetical protein
VQSHQGRRNLYLIVAWLLIQVGATVAPQLNVCLNGCRA